MSNPKTIGNNKYFTISGKVAGERVDSRIIEEQLQAAVTQGHRNLDGRVCIIALANVQKTGNASNIAEVELVETIFAAGERENSSVLRHGFSEFCVIVAP